MFSSLIQKIIDSNTAFVNSLSFVKCSPKNKRGFTDKCLDLWEISAVLQDISSIHNKKIRKIRNDVTCNSNKKGLGTENTFDKRCADLKGVNYKTLLQDIK